jgi:uncharacterized protein (DUF305 family)
MVTADVDSSTIRRGLVAVATTVLLGAGGCGSKAAHPDAAPTALMPTPFGVTHVSDADVAFVQQMIPHHQQAVAMATLAETRANDRELRQLAATIKGVQQPEIDTMTIWLAAWGHPTSPPASPGANPPIAGNLGTATGGPITEAALNQLAALKGADFDTQFVGLMIVHHNATVTLAKTEVKAGTSRDAVALAKLIVKTQSGEVATLEDIEARL